MMELVILYWTFFKAIGVYVLLPMYLAIGIHLGVKNREEIINALFYRHETMDERLERAGRRFKKSEKEVEFAKMHVHHGTKSASEERRDTDGIVRYWKSNYQLANNCFVL